MITDNQIHQLLTKKTFTNFYTGHQKTFESLDPNLSSDRILFRKFVIDGIDKSYSNALESAQNANFQEPHPSANGKRVSYFHPEHGEVQFNVRSIEHPNGDCTVMLGFSLRICS